MRGLVNEEEFVETKVRYIVFRPFRGQLLDLQNSDKTDNSVTIRNMESTQWQIHYHVKGVPYCQGLKFMEDTTLGDALRRIALEHQQEGVAIEWRFIAEVEMYGSLVFGLRYLTVQLYELKEGFDPFNVKLTRSLVCETFENRYGDRITMNKPLTWTGGMTGRFRGIGGSYIAEGGFLEPAFCVELDNEPGHIHPVRLGDFEFIDPPDPYR
jgi:hypothetical protein